MNDWLSRIEIEYDIEILFACEAGSRAWGLENKQSDFDVRFIYRYRSLKKYLSLKKASAVLDFQTPIDASGFDLFKALELISKSNPNIYEWAYSPVVYNAGGTFLAQLIKIIETSYSPFSLYKHYGSLKSRNVKEISKGEYSFKKQKQLLQAYRAELIRSGLKHGGIIRSPFEFIEDAKQDCPNLFSAYSIIAAAKKDQFLLQDAEIDNLLHLLEAAEEDKNGENHLPKIKPKINELESWIWSILGV